MAEPSYSLPAAILPVRALPNLDQLRQYAGNVLPQAERNGLEMCFLNISASPDAEPVPAAAANACGELVASRILGCIRAGDYLAAKDAGEYVVVLAAGCPPLAAARIAERIQHAVEKPALLAGAPAKISCRIGITTTRDDLLDVDRILANSALALRQCTDAGTSPICHFSRSTQAEIERQMRVATELEGALADARIVPWFQPQVSLQTGVLTGLEALVRWDHPERGILSPAEFLDVAEESGQIETIGEAVLTGSIKALRDWRAEGFDVPRVAVNLSTAQLTNPYLADLISWELDRQDIEPDHLTIEILETVLGSSDDGVIARNLRRLKAIGVKVDLDDFGTGNASIINIRRFGVHRIKIDRAFIRGIDRDPEQQKITSAMIIMAQALGVEVLAEGVETLAEERFMQHLGCQYMQGFGLARPMPAAAVTDWLRQRARKTA